MSKLKQFIEDSFVNFVKQGGNLLTREHYEARREVCRGCEYEGQVEPLPDLFMEGCTECGCPFKTKAYFDTWKVSGKKIKCPHPDGNKWENVDNNFKSR
jgi:hypothetical protein